MASRKVCYLVFVSLYILCVTAENSEDFLVPKSREKRATDGITLRVTTILHDPYVMLDSSNENNFTGFIPDLLDGLSMRTGITFKLHLVQDGRYGSLDDDGQWNGMIGEVLLGETNASDDNAADMAAAALVITSLRKQVVNFLDPFQHGGYTILARKRSKSDTYPNGNFAATFQILAPLGPGVWIMCLFAFAVVSILLWVMNRFNPYEWRGRYNLGFATEQQASTFNIQGAFWFTFTTLQWQGFDRSPRSIGARLLAGFWFIFVTVFLVTYTGSLVNNLFWASTAHSNNPSMLPFRNLEELILHPQYKVGVLSGGSTFRYLTRVAKGDEFRQLQEFFYSDAGGDYLLPSYSAAYERLRSGDKFGLIMETPQARYACSQRPCDLVTVGPSFGRRSYGMPVRKNLDQSVINGLEMAIMMMQEMGETESLENKWFDQGSCWNVTRIESVQRLNALYLNKPKVIDLGMFWGPLVFLLVGIIISAAATGAEILYFRLKGKQETFQFHTSNQPGGRKMGLEEDNMS